MSEKIFGVTYNPDHVYKILRAGYSKGGGSKVSPKEFDDEVLGKCFTRALMEYSELLPEGRISKTLTQVNKILPNELVDTSWRIKRYLDGHGPFSPLAVGLMTSIIEMRRMGITECKIYFALLERLDETPANSLSEYIRIITEFEKELE